MYHNRRARGSRSQSKIEISAFLSWSELTGAPRTTRQELVDAIRRFDAKALLLLCSQVGLILNTGSKDKANWQSQLELISQLLPAELANRVRSSGRHAFTRRQLLFIAREAILNGHDTVGQRLLPELFDFAKLCLQASDHLDGPSYPPEDHQEKIAYLAHSFMRTYEAACAEEPLLRFIRTYASLRHLPNLTDEERHFAIDVEAKFETATQIPVNVYAALSWACSSYYLNAKLNYKSFTAPSVFLPASWFDTTSLSREVVEKFMSDVALSLQDSKTSLSGSDNDADFALIQDRPFLMADGGLYCLDYRYAVEKFDTGIFWRTLKVINREESRQYFFSMWGHLFEKYVSWFMAESCSSKKNKYVPSPKYLDTGEEFCDGLIINGNELVVLEYKTAMCPAQAKYGNDYKPFKQFLDQRLVEGHSGRKQGKRKGAGQLLHGINEVFGGRRKLKEVDTDVISAVYPMIVTKDDVGSSLFVNEYINVRFSKSVERKKYTASVAPITCMNVDTLERLCLRLHRETMTSILSARIKSDRNLRHPFWFTFPKSESELARRRASMNKFGVYWNTRHPAIDLVAEELIAEMVQTLGIGPTTAA